MQTLITAFVTVFPILAYMLIGIGTRKAGLLSEKSRGELNALVFKLLLPASIFNNLYHSDLEGADPGPVLLYGASAVILTAALAWFVYSRIEPERSRRPVLIQNAFRSNFVLFGLPLSRLLLEGKHTHGLTEILIAVIVPIFNILAVFILQFYREDKVSFKSVLLGILRNPLIISAVAGLLFKLSGLSLPVLLAKPLQGLAQCATPLALIVLGAGFSFQKSREFAPKLAAAVAVRLLLVPALCLGGAVLLGFRNEALVAYICMFASPVAVASYAMAQQMDADHELAGQILVYDSLFSSFSLFLIIALFTHCGWI